MSNWEATLDKPYDAARKGSSALIAAAGRSLFAEVSVLNGLKVCGTFFDLHKFYDTVQPEPLFEAIVETNFPIQDAMMGFQMHMAPRTIIVNTLPSLPIRIDVSILAGCLYRL